MTRILQHTLALLILVAILVLNGCAPMAFPAGQAPAAPAASGGDAAAQSGNSESASSGSYEAPAADAGAAPAAESSYPRVVDPARPAQSGQYEAVTAGVTDDNEQWGDYLNYLNRHSYDLYVNRRDVSERYIIRVVDDRSLPVHDAEVTIKAGDSEIFNGRTDAGGQMYFFPRALEQRWQWQANEYQVIAKKGYVAQSQTFYRGTADQWTLTLNNPQRSGYTQLDLLFLIDATGSMGDEIDKLKASMADVANQIAGLPERPDTRYGLVAYRDQGDQFVVRTHDFTTNLDRFQRDLVNVYADGGGDTPEALNEALHRSLNDLSWRGDDTVRLIILVADAPPHLDYHWESFSYDVDMFEAVRRGIKIFPVGASNLEADGEYVFRQLAQVTGGKFVFLTYEEGSDPSSGPGAETDHEVDNYSVDTLDRLVVRLVREELAKLGELVQIPAQQQAYPPPTPTATPVPPVQPQSCTIDFVRNWTDCNQTTGFSMIERSYNSALIGMQLTSGTGGFERARFDITYGGNPDGYTVNIGDAIGESYGTESSELALLDDELQVFGNAAMAPQQNAGNQRVLRVIDNVVRNGETLTLDVSSQRLGLTYGGGIEVVDSPYLFNFGYATEQMNLFAAFNRTIADKFGGSGVSKVVITLYPAR